MFDFNVFANRQTKPKEITQAQQNTYATIRNINTADNSVTYGNNYGNVIIKGIGYLSSYDQNKAVSIEELKVSFSSEIKNAQMNSFNQVDVDIEFYLNEVTKRYIEDNYDKLRSPAIVFNDNHSNPSITIKQKGINDYNIRQVIEFNQRNQRETFDEMTTSNFAFQRRNDYDDDSQQKELFKDFHGDSHMKHEDKYIESHSPSLNRQYSHSTVSSYNLNTYFIDFEKEEVPLYEKTDKKKLINSNIYDPKEMNPSMQKFNHSIKGDFNAKGSFITSGSCNDKTFMHQISLKQLIPNRDLVSSKDNDLTLLNHYKQNTIVQYINELTKTYANDNDMMDEDTDDCNSINNQTKMLCSYIAGLECFKLKISTSIKTCNNAIKQYLERLYHRIRKEVSTLKLFKILFLNCFMPLKTSNEEYSFEKFHIQSELNEVNTMRKRKLIEWLIEEKSELYSNEQNSIRDVNEKIFHAVINGQIKTAVNICIKEKMTYLGMLISQLNNQKKSETLKSSIINWTGTILHKLPDKINQSYQLMGQNDHKMVIADSPKSDWMNILIQLGLYGSLPNNKINDLIEALDQLLAKNPTKMPYESKNIYKINYILLKLFSSIEKSDTNTMETMLKMLSYSRNIFNNDSDHHVHFIMSSILNMTLRHSYTSKTEQIDKCVLLKKLHLNLLQKTIEEICLCDTSLVYWKYAVKLINLSVIPNRVKEEMIKDIIYTIEPETENDIEEITHNSSYNASAWACVHLSDFNYKEALNQFKLNEDYNHAIDIYINCILCTDIITSSIKVKESTNELKELGKKAIVNWETFGGLFYEYLLTLDPNNLIDIPFLTNLIQKFIALNRINSSYSNEALFSLCKAKILFDLRKCLNNKIKEVNSSRKGSTILLTPISANHDINEKNYMEWSTKLNEFNTVINGILEYKSKVFSNAISA